MAGGHRERPPEGKVEGMAEVVADAARLAEARIRLHRQLLAEGRAEGELLPPRLSAALLYVPRHPFVPVLYRRADGGLIAHRPSDGDGQGWLDAVYSDQPLVTEVDEATGAPACAAVRPGLLAGVLDALDVQRGHRVLEIGTGTGYGAALLCWLAGREDNVTSIDTAPERLDRAGERLAAIGYRPFLTVAEADEGYPMRAPYDRVVTARSVPRVPATWLRQCVPGALMVLPLNGAPAWLEVQESGTASGRLMHLPGVGTTPRHPGGPVHPELTGWPDIARPTVVPGGILDDAAFCFFAMLQLPESVVRDDRGGPGTRLYDTASRSQARVFDRTVHVVGQRDLWAAVEAAHEQWLELHRPRREWFEVKVTPERQWVAFRTPGGTEHTWDLH